MEEVEEAPGEGEGPVCACCTFGNHDIICTCDGEGCCHPEAYKQYNRSWGHGIRTPNQEEK